MTSFKTIHFQTSHKHSYWIPISIYSPLSICYFMFSDYVQMYKCAKCAKWNKVWRIKCTSSNHLKDCVSNLYLYSQLISMSQTLGTIYNCSDNIYYIVRGSGPIFLVTDDSKTKEASVTVISSRKHRNKLSIN